MSNAERLKLAIELYRLADDGGSATERLGAYLHLAGVVREIRAARASS